MKAYIKIVKLYKFDELEAKAKERAIEEHRIFLLTTMHPNDFISGVPEYDTPEQLEQQFQGTWTYYEENDAPIIESIQANDYDFLATGELIGESQTKELIEI